MRKRTPRPTTDVTSPEFRQELLEAADQMPEPLRTQIRGLEGDIDDIPRLHAELADLDQRVKEIEAQTLEQMSPRQRRQYRRHLRSRIKDRQVMADLQELRKAARPGSILRPEPMLLGRGIRYAQASFVIALVGAVLTGPSTWFGVHAMMWIFEASRAPGTSVITGQFPGPFGGGWLTLAFWLWLAWCMVYLPIELVKAHRDPLYAFRRTKSEGSSK